MQKREGVKQASSKEDGYSKWVLGVCTEVVCGGWWGGEYSQSTHKHTQYTHTLAVTSPRQVSHNLRCAVARRCLLTHLHPHLIPANISTVSMSRLSAFLTRSDIAKAIASSAVSHKPRFAVAGGDGGASASFKLQHVDKVQVSLWCSDF